MRYKVFVFGLMIVSGLVALTSCSGSNLMWYTSNGIVSYNRHTGQFEMLWENSGKGNSCKCDSTCECRTLRPTP